MVSANLGRSKQDQGGSDLAHVRDLASDYIDRELDQVPYDRVEAHLGWCPPCQASIDILRATMALLKSSKSEASGSIRERLRNKLRQDGSE